MSDRPQKKPIEPLPTLSQFDLHARLADTPGVALVTFTAAGCGACRHLRQVWHEVAGLRPDWALFEVDAERDPALVNEFEVFHLPTVFLFFDGLFHCQLESEARPKAIVDAVDAALQQPAQEAP